MKQDEGIPFIKIRIGTREIDFSRRELLSGLLGLSHGVFQIAQMVLEAHRFGWMYAKGSAFGKIVWRHSETNQAVVDAVSEDILLHTLFINLIDSAGKLTEQDKRISHWIAKYYGIQDIDDLKERARFNRKINKAQREANQAGESSPLWVKDDEYLGLVEELQRIVSSIYLITSKIEDRIILIEPQLKNEFVGT